MILVDRDIKVAIEKGWIAIQPLNLDQLQPASYDMILADQIARIVPRVDIIDPRKQVDYTEPEFVDEDLGFVIHPGEFVLATSEETFTLDACHVSQINGKSSLARMGLQVEAAGFFDPGWHGKATLELVNLATRPIRLYPGMKVAQMVFFMASGEAERPYGHPELRSKYKGQTGPTPSRMHLEQ